MTPGGAGPAAGCPRSSAGSNVRSEPEETSGARLYPVSLYSEPEHTEHPYGKLQGWQSRGLYCLGLKAHVPASPHLPVRLQGEKTSEKGEMKLF